MNPEEMERLFDDPNFVSQMNEMMNSPVFMEMMDQSPMLRGNPALRQMLRNPEFRRMMFTPENMRRNMQLSRAMAGSGSFPAPGATDNNTADAGSGGTPAAAGTGQAAAPGADSLASLLGQNPGAESADLGQTLRGIIDMQRQLQQHQAPPAAGAPATNPLAGMTGGGMESDPAFLETLRELFRSTGAGAGDPTGTATGAAAAPPAPGAAGLEGLGGLGGLPWLLANLPGGPGAAAAAAPVDTRPPEERFEAQLRQLNDMGFVEFERNIEALRRSGGSVQGAVEYLLSNPM
jgi:ubiquilin